MVKVGHCNYSVGPKIDFFANLNACDCKKEFSWFSRIPDKRLQPEYFSQIDKLLIHLIIQVRFKTYHFEVGKNLHRRVAVPQQKGYFFRYGQYKNVYRILGKILM